MRCFELPFVHLPVGDLELHPRAQCAQPLGGLVDRLDPVVQEERLALSLVLAQQRSFDQLLVVLADVGLDRAPALGGRLDHADVADPGHRHLERARDRRRAHRDHVDLQLELAEQLLLLYAEPLLLVDDQQAELLRADIAAQQAMRADEDVDLAVGEPLDGLALLGLWTETRHVLDRDRVVLQALGERAVVLLGEDRGGDEQHHLLAVLDGLERGAQRDFGLAVADVAADQAVHRARRLHVRLDHLDRVALVGRLGERERVLEVALPVAVARERVTLAPLALGVQVEQLPGELLCRSSGSSLEGVPTGTAQLGEGRVNTAGADVAADLRELVDRDEHAVRARVLEVQIVARDVRDGLRVEAGEPRDPVVLVDDDVAGPQVGEAAQHAAPALDSVPALPLRGAAAMEQAVLRDHREVELRRDEALLQPGVGERDQAVRARGAVQPVHLQPAEVVRGPLALTAARERHDRAVGRTAGASRARARPP